MSEAALGEASKGLFVVSIRTTKACKEQGQEKKLFQRGEVKLCVLDG